MKNKPKSRRNLAKHVETSPPITPRPRQMVDNKTALQFLDSLIALAPVNRQTHIQAQQALTQISGALQELETLKKEPPKKEKP